MLLGFDKGMEISANSSATSTNMINIDGLQVISVLCDKINDSKNLAYVPCKNSPATSHIIMTSACYYNLYQTILRTSTGRQVSKSVCFRSTGFYT